jgi:hypothetical protein
MVVLSAGSDHEKIRAVHFLDRPKKDPSHAIAATIGNRSALAAPTASYANFDP